VALPKPTPGLVIQYAYLWRDEALQGREDAVKDRPCVVILAVEDRDGHPVVTVAPVTHSPPRHPDIAVEIPAATKARLGLDSERSWVVVADLNRFVWPGVDLRPARRGSRTFVHGLLPHALYDQIRQKTLALARAGKARITPRTE